MKTNPKIRDKMKVRIILYIFAILSFAFISQEILAQDTKTFYVDSTGRLFVNPGTPVYLYLSTSPTGEDAVRVQSIQPEGNPMYWDGHGVHYLTHMDLYLGRKIRFDLFADGRPPQTSAKFNVKEGVQRGHKIFLSGSAVLELASIDPHSGVKSIHYSVNGSEYQPYTQPLTFNRDGDFSVRFYAIDNVGNREDEGERVIVIDTTTPTTTLTIDGPQHNEVVAPSTKFVLTATDSLGVQSTHYTINEGNELRYTRPISLSHLPEGVHSIAWHSIDEVGNTEQKQSFEFFVDRTPPMVFEEISGNTYMVAGREYSSGRSQFRIVAVDNKAGVKEIYYSINNSPFQLYEKPIFLSEISGAVSVRSYAIDNVGNRGVSDAEGQQFSMPEVDITGPNISHSFTGKRVTLRDTIWISPITKINIHSNDRGSGLNRIEYRLNNNTPVEYSAPFTVEQQGYHTVNSSAWDNVENLNISSFGFGVDNQAPQIFYHFSVKPYKKQPDGELNVFPPNVQLYVAATDDKVGVDRITVTVNGGRERNYTQPISGFKLNQLNTVTLKATDRLGNESSQTFTFWIE